MYGIRSKTAKVIALTTLALGVTAIAPPAAADSIRHGGRGGYGNHDGDRYGRGAQYKHDRRNDHRHGYRRGDRHDHRYWRKHGHHGVTVHVWKPLGHRPAYAHRRVHAACHPVIGHGSDHFGRRAKFGGTMCYDRFGRGYVVAGSRYVIHYF